MCIYLYICMCIWISNLSHIYIGNVFWMVWYHITAAATNLSHPLWMENTQPDETVVASDGQRFEMTWLCLCAKQSNVKLKILFHTKNMRVLVGTLNVVRAFKWWWAFQHSAVWKICQIKAWSLVSSSVKWVSSFYTLRILLVHLTYIWRALTRYMIVGNLHVMYAIIRVLVADWI